MDLLFLYFQRLTMKKKSLILLQKIVFLISTNPYRSVSFILMLGDNLLFGCRLDVQSVVSTCHQTRKRQGAEQ